MLLRGYSLINTFKFKKKNKAPLWGRQDVVCARVCQDVALPPLNAASMTSMKEGAGTLVSYGASGGGDDEVGSTASGSAEFLAADAALEAHVDYLVDIHCTPVRSPPALAKEPMFFRTGITRSQLLDTASARYVVDSSMYKPQFFEQPMGSPTGTHNGYVPPKRKSAKQGQLGITCTLNGQLLALFRVGEDFFAIQNRCPHQVQACAQQQVVAHCIILVPEISSASYVYLTRPQTGRSSAHGRRRGPGRVPLLCRGRQAATITVENKEDRKQRKQRY